jgi:hypothetical protein
MSRRRRSVTYAPVAPVTNLAIGFIGGLTAGLLLSSRYLQLSRAGLFSPSPLRRLAALSYLAARPSVDTSRLLRDYIRWEPRPILRRRAELALRGIEASLDR